MQKGKSNNNLLSSVNKNIHTILKKEKFNLVEFAFLIQNIRIFLELKKLTKKYEIVNQYCNWVLHAKINKGNAPYILNSAQDAFKELDNEQEIINMLSDSLKLVELIQQIKTLFWVEFENKEPIGNFDCDKNWYYFLSFLLESLMFKPLEVNNENIYIEKFGFDIRGVQIVKLEGGYVLEIISKKLLKQNKRIYVDIVLKKHTNVQKKSLLSDKNLK